MWNTQGDGVQRKYDYTYDDADRLSGAAFLQNSNGAWSNAAVDFSTSNLSYDANGNILTVNRNGLKVNQSSPIDELSYTYQSNSNKLQQVIDGANDPNSTLGDFHYNGTKTGTDYTYDGNGNLTSDANKKISAVTYNYLDLPLEVSMTGKGTIRYVYDADGDKLEKVVTDISTNPSKVTTTNYCHGFVYNRDTLLYMLTGEGRIRPLNSPGQPFAFTTDYFLRDHLGSVRSVITEQTKEDTYGATMESQNATVENQLFDNISSTSVPKPAGFDSDTDNKQVSQLDGSSGNDSLPRVGPAIVLKVMAGDTVTISHCRESIFCSRQECISEYNREAPWACSTEPRNSMFFLDTVIGRIVRSEALSKSLDNATERAIRCIKVKQKVSSQFKTAERTSRFAVIRSVIDTMIKQGQNVHAGLSSIASFAPS